MEVGSVIHSIGGLRAVLGSSAEHRSIRRNLRILAAEGRSEVYGYAETYKRVNDSESERSSFIH